MGCNLPRRVDGQRLVAKFQVDAVEKPDLVQSYDVPEVPAYQDIDLGHRGYRDMQHVVTKFLPENTMGLIRPQKLQCLLSYRKLVRYRRELGEQVTNRLCAIATSAAVTSEMIMA